MKIVQTSNMVAARTTPHGFWRFSANYLLAARIVEVKIHEEGQLFFPTLQLYGIVIELALKAFLLKRGLTLNDVRSLSHNLTKTLALARRHKLGREVKRQSRCYVEFHSPDGRRCAASQRSAVVSAVDEIRPLLSKIISARPASRFCRKSVTPVKFVKSLVSLFG